MSTLLKNGIVIDYASNTEKKLDILLENEKGTIDAEIITKENNEVVTKQERVDFNDFLINKGETGIGKYGQVLNKVIELTKE